MGLPARFVLASDMRDLRNIEDCCTDAGQDAVEVIFGAVLDLHRALS